MSKSQLKIVATTIAVQILAGTAFFFIFVFSGVYSLAATAPHTPPVKWVMTAVRTYSIKAHARKTVIPENFPAINPADGFAQYDEMCIVCHGAPGAARSAIAKGLYPEPPDLAKIANQLKPEEVFWTVSNGLKMAGMPAFSPTHEEASLWSITAFVKKLPVISPAEYQSLRLQTKRKGNMLPH
jgi:mono/diheme cytochrome c family protein